MYLSKENRCQGTMLDLRYGLLRALVLEVKICYKGTWRAGLSRTPLSNPLYPNDTVRFVSGSIMYEPTFVDVSSENSTTAIARFVYQCHYIFQLLFGWFVSP